MKLFTFIKTSPKGDIDSIKNYGSIKALTEYEEIANDGKVLKYDNICYRLNRYGFIKHGNIKVVKNFLIQKKHSKKVIKK